MRPGSSEFPKRVLVLAPMRSELSPIVKQFGLKRNAQAARSQNLHAGRVGEVEVLATTVGVGPAVACRTATRLLDEVSVDHVVVCGIAGAVDPTCPIGQIVVPETVIDGDIKTELHPTGWIGLELSGTIMTSSTLVTEPGEIRELRARGIVALEMEGAAVGGVCEARGLPWTVVRSISDRAGDGAVDESVLGILNEDGSTNVIAAIRQIATHPGSLPKLARLAKDSQTASSAAARATKGALTR